MKYVRKKEEKISKQRRAKKSELNIVNALVKIVVFLFVLSLEIIFLWVMYSSSRYIDKYFSYIAIVIRVIAIVYILYKKERLEYKLSWIILVSVLPIVGVAVYILWGKTTVSKRLKKERLAAVNASHYLLPKDVDVINDIFKDDKHIYKQFNYLRQTTHYPVYENEGVEYFKLGEEYFKSLCLDLENAKSFILLEYFIISKGNLWNRIYKILKDKVAEGVKVNIIVDEWGSITRYPKDFFDNDDGINVYRYNPIRYGISNYINYRDHRKIAVIDGIYAYTGGLNIGDEYTNEQVRFGHWKDSGVKVTGKAAQSFMISFLKYLQVASKNKTDFEWYVNRAREMYEGKVANKEIEQKGGKILYFSDGPDNMNNPAETAYIQMLSMAKRYVYISTPYFVVSNEMLNAITSAALSGINVKIITPHRPDKWYMHITTRSYYETLLNAGVKVYEYLPGFMHSKSFVSDNELAITGTVNLDFRSMNLNYECAVLTYKTGLEKSIKEDYIATLKKSKEIVLEDVKNKNIFVKILEAIINTFSPML